jgi:hypothetical protein
MINPMLISQTAELWHIKDADSCDYVPLYFAFALAPSLSRDVGSSIKPSL